MERITRFRVCLLLGFFGLVLTFFGLRLYSSQVVEAKGREDNLSTYTQMTRVKAARGDILDRHGNVLVSNRASYDLVFNKYVILSADDTNGELLRLVKLCRELNIDYVEHFPVTDARPYEYTLDQYDSEWQGYFRSYLAYIGDLDSDITAPLLMDKLREIYEFPEEWTDEDVRSVIGLRYELTLRSDFTPLANYAFVEDATEAELSAISELNIPGLTVEPTTIREYRTTYAAHILGTVGAIDPDQWPRYKDLEGYEMDTRIGQSGLEEAFERDLHGVDGWRVDEVLKDGTVVKSYYEQEPRAGNNLETSLDLNVQIAMEDSLAKVMEALKAGPDKKADGADAGGAGGVVMSVKTGEILGCASYPTYNPNTFSEDYNQILEDPLKPLFNRALQGEYPPGSTFKMVTAIAGVDSGYYSPNTAIEDMGVFTKYEGFEAYCLAYSSDGITHGVVDMPHALQTSCNYYFYVMGDNMPISYLDETAKALGLGEPTGVELYEETGRRANPETKWEEYQGSDAEWYQADQIMAAIGQSLHLYTPIQLCSYTAALANRGERYRATFLNRVVDSDYKTLIRENEPELLSSLAISDSAYQMYTAGMKLVAQEEGGTAYRFLGDYPVKVAAKTGTAETDKGEGTSDNAAFVCYAPADDPEIAIALYAEQAGHGSSLGEVVVAILDAYFAGKQGIEVVTYENQLG